MPRAVELPTDIETLQRLVLEYQARLLSRDLEIEQLKLQLARLRRMQFGRSSEQLDAQIAQLELKLEELESLEASAPNKPTASTERRRPARRPLPPHLPRERIVHEPSSSSACSECGGA